MASTTPPFSSSTTFIDSGKALRHSAAPCVSLPHLPLKKTLPRNVLITTSCRRNALNVATNATGEVPKEVEVSSELPEIVNTLQKAWDKVEDKYAVSILAVAGVVALWASTGMISAIDKLPLVPGVLELVGIGYTGWFSYQNLIFKPDREAFIKKVTDAYKDVLGNSTN